LRDLILYSSFKFVRKFKLCVSPLVKRYPGLCSMIYNVVSRHVSIDIVSYYSTSVECPSLTNKTSILE